MPEASVTVRVTPRSARNCVSCGAEDHLIVKTTSAPVDGAANKAVIKLISEALGIARSSIRIKSGETSRTKFLVIQGVAEEDLRARIRKLTPSGVDPKPESR